MHHLTGPQGHMPSRVPADAEGPAAASRLPESQGAAGVTPSREPLNQPIDGLPPAQLAAPQVVDLIMPRLGESQPPSLRKVSSEHEAKRPHFTLPSTAAEDWQPLTAVPGEPSPVGVAANSAPAVPERLPRALWLGAVVLSMIAVRYFVPWLAEEIQYSITRGRERAQYELAGTMLASTPLAEVSTAGQRVTKRIGPSVVHINVTTSSADASATPAVRFGQMPRDAAGQGSGVIVDADGYIVTNYHVVRGASEINVGLSDGRRVGGQLIGYDEPSDLAVLKVDADKLTAAQWGDSEKLDVGSLVWAAGSPFGLQRTVTFGILSAKHRGGVAGTPYQDFLQTDAAVNPGNSGGPLVDEKGHIVGINTAIVGEAYQGVSFAVPSHVAREVYERLRFDGRVARGWLGVQMDDVTEGLAEQLGLPKPYGALVINVVEMDGNSPALKAGVEPGDVILSWNGEEVTSPSTLSRLVARTQIGASARLQLQRGREQVELTITVGERPPIE